MSQPTPEILVDDRGDGEVWLTINRARKHNALASSVLDALASEVARRGNDPGARCIVLRGAGSRYFAAGGDLVESAQFRTASAATKWADQAAAALDGIRHCPIPVVAYLNGDALGGGAELAVACDLRIVEAHARIGFIHGSLAITSAWGGGPDLCRLVGSSRALRMLARAELVAAGNAVAWGLADAVVSGGAEGTKTRAFLAPLLERPAAVLRAFKQQTLAWRYAPGYATERELERRNLATTWLGAEHWAVVDAFLARNR